MQNQMLSVYFLASTYVVISHQNLLEHVLHNQDLWYWNFVQKHEYLPLYVSFSSPQFIHSQLLYIQLLASSPRIVMKAAVAAKLSPTFIGCTGCSDECSNCWEANRRSCQRQWHLRGLSHHTCIHEPKQ